MTNTPEPGHNLSKLKKDVSDGVAEISKQKEIRQSANEEIAAIRSSLEAKGINRKALDMAMAYMNMDPDKREGFDLAYSIVREALGSPVSPQGDIFEYAAEKADGKEG